MILKELVSMHPPLSLDEELGNKEIEVIYYWYHHMMPYEAREDIQHTIDEHDWSAFKKFYNQLNSANICYLPDKVYAYCDDDFIGHLPMGEQAFSLITYSECECG